MSTRPKVAQTIGNGQLQLGHRLKKKDAHYLRRAYLEAGQALKKKRLGVSGTVLWADNDMSKQRVNYPQEKENAFLVPFKWATRKGLSKNQTCCLLQLVRIQ